MRRQGNQLGSEIMGTATDLRDALRPGGAFRAEWEKSTTEEQLQLVVLEGNLPDHINKVLDMHQSLMFALAIGARVQAEDRGELDVGRKIDKVLAEEHVEVERAKIVKAPRASFLDD